MTSYEVARWLNEESSDKEFLEVFVYLNEATSGRGIVEKDRTEEEILRFCDNSELTVTTEQAIASVQESLRNKVTE